MPSVQWYWVWFYWGLTPQQQPGSYQGGEMMMMMMMMMMKSVFWWRKPESPEETTGYSAGYSGIRFIMSLPWITEQTRLLWKLWKSVSGGFPHGVSPPAFSHRTFPLRPPPPGQVPTRSFPTRDITHPALSPTPGSYTPLRFQESTLLKGEFKNTANGLENKMHKYKNMRK